MKSWTVAMEDGTYEEIKADAVNYDNAANLCFYVQKKALATPINDGGIVADLVYCIHRDKYIKYYPTPTKN